MPLISDLPEPSLPLSGSETLPAIKTGADLKLTVAQIAQWIDARYTAFSGSSHAVTSAQRYVRYVGASAATVTLPEVGTGNGQVHTGTPIRVHNAGTGLVTVKDSDGATVATLTAGASVELIAISISPTWMARRIGNAGALDVGTTSGTVCAGDDPRLSNARTPTDHQHEIEDIHLLHDELGLKIDLNGGNFDGHESDFRAALGVLTETEIGGLLAQKANKDASGIDPATWLAALSVYSKAQSNGLLEEKADADAGNVEDSQAWREALNTPSNDELFRQTARLELTKGLRVAGASGGVSFPYQRATVHVAGHLHLGGSFVVWICPVDLSADGRIYTAVDGTSIEALSSGAIRVTVETTGDPLVFETDAGALTEMQWAKVLINIGGLTVEECSLYVNSVELEITGTDAANLDLDAGVDGYLADDNTRSISAGASGVGAFRGVVSRFSQLNYTLSGEEWQAYLLTGILPVDGVGTMENIAGKTVDNFANITSVTLTEDYDSGDAGHGACLRAVTAGGVGGMSIKIGINHYIRQARYKLSFDYKLISGANWEASLDQGSFETFAVLDSAGWTREDLIIDNTDVVFNIWLFSGGVSEILLDNIRLVRLGDLMGGLDLGGNAIVAETTNGLLGLKEADHLRNPCPTQFMLRTPIEMTEAGYFLRSSSVVPVGYFASRVWALNRGEDPVSLTLKAGGPAGTTFASDTITADGILHELEVAWPQVDPTIFQNGVPIWVDGPSATEPCDIIVEVTKGVV